MDFSPIFRLTAVATNKFCLSTPENNFEYFVTVETSCVLHFDLVSLSTDVLRFPLLLRCGVRREGHLDNLNIVKAQQTDSFFQSVLNVFLKLRMIEAFEDFLFCMPK